MVRIKERLKGSALLLSAALIWGLSFVAQSVGMESVGAFTFNGIRMIIGCAALLPVIIINNASNKRKNISPKESGGIAQLCKAGIICGLPLFFGSNIQQFAFKYTTVGKVGFITTLYIIFVPLFGLFLKRKVQTTVWISIVIAAFGMYLLCVKGSLNLNKGDLIALLCAVFFSLHILFVDRFSQDNDCVKLSYCQFFFAGTMSVVCMLIFEKPEMGAILSILPEILYAGIMSCSVAFTFQIAGQKHTEPAVASMLLCFEAVFALIFGWLILNQTLDLREITGCAIMFAALILAQLPGGRKVVQCS